MPAADPEAKPQAGAQIELRIERVAQLFNSLDPSPFQEKDLDRDAEEFIVGWARELKPDAPFSIVVHLPAAEAETEAARTLGRALSGYFAQRAKRTSSDLKELLRIGRTSLAIGLCVLALCLLSAHLIETTFGANQFARIATESLVIVGWVANWRPIEIFLYEWWPIGRRRQLYRRLAEAQVILEPR